MRPSADGDELPLPSLEFRPRTQVSETLTQRTRHARPLLLAQVVTCTTHLALSVLDGSIPSSRCKYTDPEILRLAATTAANKQRALFSVGASYKKNS